MKAGYSVVPCEWREELEGRERKQVAHAENYKYNFQGALVPSHSHLLLIAKLASILDGCGGKTELGRAEGVRRILRTVCPLLGIQMEKMTLDAGLRDNLSMTWDYTWEIKAWLSGKQRVTKGSIAIHVFDTDPAPRVARFILDRLGP